MKLLKNALFILLFFALNSFSQTKDVMEFKTYSAEFIAEKNNERDKLNKEHPEPGGVAKFVKPSDLTYLKLIEFPTEDFHEGSYKFFVKFTDDCTLYFDETKRVTNLDTKLKYDLTKTQLKILNESLKRINAVHYHDDILVIDCKNNSFSTPIIIKL